MTWMMASENGSNHLLFQFSMPHNLSLINASQLLTFFSSFFSSFVFYFAPKGKLQSASNQSSKSQMQY